MSKYARLGTYLAQQKGDRCVLTFKEIERIIGAKLPRSATDYREWWANEEGGKTRHTQAKAWMDAGWRVDTVNFGGKQVIFRLQVVTLCVMRIVEVAIRIVVIIGFIAMLVGWAVIPYAIAVLGAWFPAW